MRRIIVAFLVIAAFSALAWGFYQYAGTRTQKSTTPQLEFETITVTRGDIVASISATGSLEPNETRSVFFETSGRVLEVLVEEGDLVQEGQVLARLDDTDLQFQLRQAEANLRAALAQLDILKKPAIEADIEAAKAALAAAEAAYNDLLSGPDPDEIAAAEAAVKRAKVQLDQAQAAYDAVKWRPDVGRLPQAVQLQLATISYEEALARLRLAKKPPKQSQIAQAEAQIAQARANLERLLRGTDPEQIAAQEANVERARIAVEQAKHALEKTIVRAPISGLVTNVNVRPAQLASVTQPAFTLARVRPLHTTVQIDELDVAQVKEGQTARLVVDALPEREFKGIVTSLATMPTVQGGVVTYEARVELQEDDPALRPGMSVSVDIITSRAEDVLIIPNRVMRFDRETGEFYVDKLVEGIPVRTKVEVGLRNDQYSQIVSGLQEGDVVVVREVSSGERLRRGLFGGG